MGDWAARSIGMVAVLLVLAVPFGLLAMMVVRAVTGAGRVPVNGARKAEDREVCPDCGQGIESHWDSCEFCGAKTTGDADAESDRRRGE